MTMSSDQKLQAGLQERAIDLSATEATFDARAWHGAVHGTVPVLSGYITVDDDGQPVGVSAELDLAGLSTGNPRRDNDLRGKRFFNTDLHPVIRFEASDVVQSIDGWQIRGMLSIGGAQCPLVLHVQRGGTCYDGFTATAAITKQELGVTAPRLLIRDQITLRVSTCLLP